MHTSVTLWPVKEQKGDLDWEPPCSETITRCSFRRIVLSLVTKIGKNPQKQPSTFFFLVSPFFIVFNILKFWKWELWVLQLSYFFNVSLSFMLVRRPQIDSFLCFLICGGVCAHMRVSSQRKTKQFNHATNPNAALQSNGARQGSPGLPTVSHMSSPVKLVDDWSHSSGNGTFLFFLFPFLTPQQILYSNRRAVIDLVIPAPP